MKTTETILIPPVALDRLFRVFISPSDAKPWETIGRALGVAAAWPDPFTGEESTPQAVWNWIDVKIGGRGNRKWEDAPRGKYFIANAELSDSRPL